MRLRIDLHVHSLYSYDSVISPKELQYHARKKGLDAVAITDHDNFEGAFRVSRETDFPVIAGTEITSSQGHIVALNIQQHIPKGLAAEETVEKIHEAGGIAIACHPLALFKGSLRDHASSGFDAVEVMNSSSIPFRYCSDRSTQIAMRLKLPGVAGTDAHYGPEIGYAYTMIDAELTTDSVAKAIQQGLCQPVGGSIPFSIRVRRQLMVTAKRLNFIRHGAGNVEETASDPHVNRVSGRSCTRG